MPGSQLFDSESVSANRHGELTQDQKKAYAGDISAGRGGCLSLALAGVILVLVVWEFGKQLEALQGAAQIIGYGVILAALVIPALFVNFLYSIPARHRAASAHIERKNGEVVFQYGNYVPLIDGKRMRSIFNDEANLLPGSYTFYTIKGTNWVASSEKLADHETASAPPFELTPDLLNRVPAQFRDKATELFQMYTEANQDQSRFDVNGLRAALASTLNFDQTALDFNRQGKLAPSQKALLRKAGGSNFRYALLFVVLALGGMALLITNKKPLDPGGVAAVGLFFGGISLFFLYQSSRENADVRRGIVEVSEGPVHKDSQTYNGGRSSYTTYYYVVNNMRLEVPRSAHHALIEHLPYRVYYLPGLKQVVSAEPVIKESHETEPADSA